MLTVYGIPNCDKIKKTLNQLKQSGVDYDLYNFKKELPSKDIIMRWHQYLGDWPVNKRGTTYRKIKDNFEMSSDAEKIDLIINNSSVIIRPIVEKKGRIISIGNMKEINDYLKNII